MANYPIPEYLQDSHDGDEWAVAAVLEGRVVALLYLKDIAAHLLIHLGTPSWEFVFRRWAMAPNAVLDELRRLGRLCGGVVSSDGFRTTWEL